MLPKVHLSRRSSAVLANIDHYRALVGDELADEIQSLGQALRGIRICHINSTAYGGGVAELLPRMLPALNALGIESEWRLVHGQPEFFTVTKSFHNALQGGNYDLREPQQKIYLQVNEQSAKLFEDHYDLVMVHDPQPAAIRHFAGPRKSKWIWRCHIDSSHPDEGVSRFLRPYLEEYDAMIFTLAQFLLPDLRVKRVAFIPPGIDPLAPKNMQLPLDVCRRAIADSGIDIHRPLLLQVSRFDPWKDPLGVIEVYRRVKKEIPGVQLALIGSMAEDDPEGWDLMDRVEEASAEDDDMFVFTNLSGVGNAEVNMFQRGCDLVIQKSLREGFGLVISEALWKEKAVVAGRAGGIPMQFPKGFEQYLVDSVEECAEKAVHLLRHIGERAAFGRAGRERVREGFLVPRMIRDELKLIKEVLS